MITFIIDKIYVNVEFNTTELNEANNVINSSSTLHRELIFVAHHSIHHLAMIKLILTHMKYDQNIINNLGLAPSTMLYKKQPK